jgi:hypothetical protein
VTLKKIHLQIQDKSRDKTTGEVQTVNVSIDRDLKEENSKENESGLIIRPGGPKKEHNILLYIENLKAIVNGHVEYTVEGKPDEIKTLTIK